MLMLMTESLNGAAPPAVEECGDTPNLWMVAVEAVDALYRAQPAACAARLTALPVMSALVSLLRGIDSLHVSPEVGCLVARVVALLVSKPAFCWSVDLDSWSRNQAQRHFIHIDSYEKFSETKDGLSAQVSATERAQLRYHFSDGCKNQVFAHYLIKTTFTDAKEIFAAIRWLHGSDDEEVMLRWRHTSVVVGGSIEIPFPNASAFNHIAIGRYEGCDVVVLNGLPVYWRAASSPAPTGVVLDLIGASSTSVRADVSSFFVTDDGLPVCWRDVQWAHWVELLLEGYAHRQDLGQMSRCLYAFSGVDAPLSQRVYVLALHANLQQQPAYRDYVTDLLIDRLPMNTQADALADLVGREPAPVLVVEQATVRISSNPSLHASLGRLFGRGTRDSTLLDRIDLRAYVGDIVGIIGKNGAGKTTFLKTLVAAMPLTEGCIRVDGHPIMLRPGAGMQGDLTGRENVLKTGLYMGFLPDELDELIDEIIEFSELGEHIDRPFRYYSDGMRARLIFSLATAIPRDILLLDELLTAGDMGFQRKAMERLNRFIARAKLVFVVQHTFDFILSRCTKCLLLEHGRPVYFGDPAIATELYKESL